MQRRFKKGDIVKLVDEAVLPEFEWVKKKVYSSEMDAIGTIIKTWTNHIRVRWSTGVNKRYILKYDD